VGQVREGEDGEEGDGDFVDEGRTTENENRDLMSWGSMVSSK